MALTTSKAVSKALRKFKDFSYDPDVDFKTTFSSDNYISQMKDDVKDLYSKTYERFMQHCDETSKIIDSEEYGSDSNFLTHLVYLTQLDYFQLFQYHNRASQNLIKRAIAIELIEKKLHIKLFSVLQSVDDEEKIGRPNHQLKLVILNVYTFFTDNSEEFAYELTTISNLFDYLINSFRNVKPKSIKDISTDQKSAVIALCMSVVYNCLLHERSKEVIKEKYNLMNIMEPFTASDVGMVTLLSTVSMAHVADENQAKKFSSNKKGVTYAIRSLRQALDSKSFGNNDGWTAFELAKGIGRLAVNDANKKLLVDNGAIEPLYKLSLSKDDEEATEACEALWNLAFKKELRKDILAVGGLKQHMERLSKSDRPCQKPAEGLLWLLMQDDGKGKTPFQNPKEKKAKPQDASLTVDNTKGHIMISYQWGHQELIKEIKANLSKRGYNVWLDIEKMNGSTLQAMAEAVEQSCLILICMSPKYKESANCRMEAEYTLNCKKEFLPLIMSKNYKPDGWLGFMLGSKLYYDFSGKYDIQEKFDELMRAIENKVKPSKSQKSSKVESIEVIKKETAIVQLSPPTPKVLSKTDIKKWIDENKLGELKKLSTLTVKKIEALKILRKEAPEYFYQVIKNELGIASLENIADFIEAFSKL